MKKVFLALGLMLSALALTNCSNNYDDVTPNVQGEEFEIFASAPSTKTVLGDGFVTSWEADDAINLFCGADGSQGEFKTAEADGVFKGTLSGVDFTQENTWYAIYPYNSNINTAAAKVDGDGWIGFGNNCSQDGYNSYAHLTDKYAPLYGITTTDADNTKVAFQMHHLGSMVKVVVTNAADKAVTITSVKFATKNSGIGGGHFVDLTANPIAYKSAYPTPYKDITLTVKNGTALAPGAKAEFYIATLPFEAAAGEELTLAVTTTERGEDSVVKTLTSAINFEAGHIKVLNFSYDKEAPANPFEIVPVGEGVTGDYEQKEPISWTFGEDDNFTVVANQAGASDQPRQDADGTFRFYKSSTLTFTAKKGAIIKIEATVTKAEEANYTASEGTITTATTSMLVWEGKTQEVVLTNNGKAARLNPIKVYYTDDESGILKSSSLSFDKTEVEVDLKDFNGTFVAPGYTLTPAGGELTWSSNNGAVATVAANGDVTIEGATGIATITATFAGNEEYKGCSASYTISVSNSTEPTWTLVTDASSLKADDQIIIAAAGYDYAMSTTQNTNNRAQAAITKSGNTIVPDASVQKFTLKVGKTSGTWAFYTGSGYIYAASSSKNYLKTETNLSANSSWNVTITGTGVATIKATGSNTRNWLRYNSSNNPPIFSCYSSGQADVVIYRLQ